LFSGFKSGIELAIHQQTASTPSDNVADLQRAALVRVNGYVPTTGDAFTILNFATRNGSDFANPPAGFTENFDDVNGNLTVLAQ
jgi:hypothetical protein